MRASRDEAVAIEQEQQNRNVSEAERTRILAVPIHEDLHRYTEECGCLFDSHESDLYLPDSPRVELVLTRWQDKHGGLSDAGFRNEITGTRWHDFAFMFTPWWAARSAAHRFK